MYDLFKDITPPTEEPTPSLFDNISPQSYESVKNNDEIKKAAVRFARPPVRLDVQDALSEYPPEPEMFEPGPQVLRLPSP